MNKEATKLIRALGERDLIRLFNVTRPAVYKWRKLGVPASRFRSIARLCASRGIDCPSSAFRFKSGEAESDF